jgi:hypothetical protein
MVWNQITFGSFMPVSGQVKSWWGTLNNSIYGDSKSLLTVLGLSPDKNNGPWSLLTSPILGLANSIASLLHWNRADILFGILLVILLLSFLLLMRVDQGRLSKKVFALLIPSLMVSNLLHITKYTATSYAATRSWYWIGEMLLLVMIGSVVLDGLFTWMDQWKPKIKLSWWLAAVLAIVLIYNYGLFVYRLAPPTVPEDMKDQYLSEAKDLEFYTKPNTKIGMTGSGMVGYFIQDRTIINLDGLINSVEYFNAMKNGNAAEFLDNLGLDYVYGKPYIFLKADPYKDIFTNRLREVGYIRGIGSFTLFEYISNN